MIIITAGMVGIFFVLFGIFKTLKELLLELKLDYKVISPKVHQIVENLENTTSIFSIFSIFKRNKKK